MKPINLTKKLVGNGRIRITSDGKYVSNGHWACRRELLKQAALLTSVEAIEALYPRARVDDVTPRQMEQVIPYYSEPVNYVRTRWIQAGPLGDAVLFAAGDGSQVWLDRRYVEMFDLWEVTGESEPGKVTLTSVMVGERSDWNVVVMPQRLDYQESLK